MPCQYSFWINVGLRGLDVRQNHQLGLGLETPEGQQVFHQDAPVSAANPEPESEADDTVVVVGTLITNIPLPVSGWYRLVVAVDGSPIGSQPVLVKEARRLG